MTALMIAEPRVRRCTRKVCSCRKVSFTSKKQARRALRSAGYRIRAYPCPDGRGFHVTRIK